MIWHLIEYFSTIDPNILVGRCSHSYFYILYFHIKDTASFFLQYFKEDVVAKILICVFLRVWSGSFFFLFHLFFFFFFDSEGGLPLLTWNLQYCTMILTRIRMTVKHAGFEWCLNRMVHCTNEPPHLHQWAITSSLEPLHVHHWATTSSPMSHHIFCWANTSSPMSHHIFSWAVTSSPMSHHIFSWATTCSPLSHHFFTNEPPHLHQWVITSSPTSHHIFSWAVTSSPMSHPIFTWATTCSPLSHHIFTNESSHLLLSHHIFTIQPSHLNHWATSEKLKLGFCLFFTNILL